MRIWEFQEIAPPRVGAISWKPPKSALRMAPVILLMVTLS